jgi:hypothetical protein
MPQKSPDRALLRALRAPTSVLVGASSFVWLIVGLISVLFGKNAVRKASGQCGLLDRSIYEPTTNYRNPINNTYTTN